jgi:ribosome-associated protein
MSDENIAILNAIAQTIFDKKGVNILVLDVREISTMTDYFLIAEGTVDRHVKALCLSIQERLEDLGMPPYHLEGDKEGDWIVMDYGEIVVHLLIPEMREKYALEELWKKAKIVDVEIVISNE